MNETLVGGLTPELRAAMEVEIDPGETVLWMGRPTPERVRRKCLLSCWVVGLGAMGLGCIFLALPVNVAYEILTLPREAMTRKSGLGGDIAAIVVFGALGLAVIAGGVWTALYLPGRNEQAARRTAYGLTPSRLLRVHLRPAQEPVVESYEPAHPLHVMRRPYRDGTADLLIGPRVVVDAGSRKANTGAFVLEAIRDAREVDRLIRAAFDPPRVVG